LVVLVVFLLLGIFAAKKLANEQMHTGGPDRVGFSQWVTTCRELGADLT
jgi:hypothetical protein